MPTGLAWADDVAAVAEEGAFSAAEEAAVAIASPADGIGRGIPYKTPQFVVKVPDGWRLLPEAGEEARVAAVRGQMLSNAPAGPPSPIVAKFASSNNKENVSVVAKTASSIRPTLFQVTDISQWGTVEEAGKLLIPRGSKLIYFEASRPPPVKGVTTTEQQLAIAAKDKDKLSLISTDVLERNYYKYEFEIGTSHIYLTAAALNGEIYVVATTVRKEEWDDKVAARARFVSDTFRIFS